MPLPGITLPPRELAAQRLRPAAAALESVLPEVLALLHRRQPFFAVAATDALAHRLGWNWAGAHLTALGHGAVPCQDQVALLLVMLRSDAQMPHGESV